MRLPCPSPPLSLAPGTDARMHCGTSRRQRKGRCKIVLERQFRWDPDALDVSTELSKAKVWLVVAIFCKHGSAQSAAELSAVRHAMLRRRVSVAA
eukprot:366206-Chlamydomonas_euryale.AAC.6